MAELKRYNDMHADHDGINEMETGVLRDIQIKGLEILLVFDKFCEENNLLYYLCGGCCIGAVRNSGFIPWDDDVDVMMPREDFNKLKSLWAPKMGHTKYRFNDNSKDNYLRTMWASISDEDSTFIKKRQADLDISHGIKLEIIPLDGCPKSKIARKMQIFWALIHQLFIMQEPPVSKGIFLNLLGKVPLAIVRNWKDRYQIACYAEKQMSKYPFKDSDFVTELTTRYKYMKNKYPRNAFDKNIRVEFEGHQIPIPVGYDTYLKKAFGSYMDLPPENERLPRHDAVYIDTKKGYCAYKGIYYCTDDMK